MFTILGPTDAAFARLRGKFRKHIFIKSSKEKDPGGALVRSALNSAQDVFSRYRAATSKQAQLIIDVDPQGMM
jgi:primosomal protein N' (replication factor Y)